MTRILAVLTAGFLSSALNAQDASLDIGSKAPSAVVQTLDGKPFDIGRYIGKTPVVLEFWATWCSLCKDLEPALRAAHTKFGKQVKFVGIAVSINQTPQRVKLYAAKHKLPLEIYFDKKGDASTAYDVIATSTIVVIDRKGMVVYTGQGGDQDIEAAIKKAL
ncbi:MAG: TlpA family protein disulfide reductase [Anaerolineae bacterium]|nr:TlpA family protein disulfide reductase [Gemmatimonadaceae bacterium]